MAVIGGFLVGYGAYVAAGPTTAVARELLPGVEYERFSPGSAVAHMVTIDLDNPCVAPAASQVAADGTAQALKTITWAEQESMAVAINGSFFYPYDQSRFWDVTPEEGEEVTVLGPTVFTAPDGDSGDSGDKGKGGDGISVSVSATQWDGHTLSIHVDGRASIADGVADGAVVAITGRDRLIEAAEIVAPESQPYPRTVVGVDETGTTMWWLVVDGKQPGYSAGLSLAEAAGILLERGAYDALELDGGGSSILVARAEARTEAQAGGEVERLSRPMQIRIPGRSRAVANHLGLRVPTGPGC